MINQKRAAGQLLSECGSLGYAAVQSESKRRRRRGRDGLRITNSGQLYQPDAVREVGSRTQQPGQLQGEPGLPDALHPSAKAGGRARHPESSLSRRRRPTKLVLDSGRL